MKCKYLRDNGICLKLSDSEVTDPCVEGPCEHDTTTISKYKRCPHCGHMVEMKEMANTRTASPRFTEVEREAIEMTLLSAEDVLSLEKICRPVKGVGKTNKLADAIATVRKMLEGSV